MIIVIIDKYLPHWLKKNQTHLDMVEDSIIEHWTMGFQSSNIKEEQPPSLALTSALEG